MTPMMSVPCMIRSSSPSSFTSVPDHLPNRMRSPGLHFEGDDLPLSVASAGTDGDDLALHRLFLSGIGNDDAAARLLFGGKPADHDPIMQRTKFHWIFD